MNRPGLFVELCCGSAAVTLRLCGGPLAVPPVAYMGSKRGYATAILHVLGLRPGQGADAVLLNDPGPWSRVWRVLLDPDGRRLVAAQLRAWAGEEPRALWERLVAEAVPLDDGDAAARWLTLQRWAILGKDVVQEGGRFVSPGFSATDACGREACASFGAVPPQLPATPDRVEVAGAAFPPATLVLSDDAAALEPRAVARWLFVQGRALCGTAAWDGSGVGFMPGGEVHVARRGPSRGRPTVHRPPDAGDFAKHVRMLPDLPAAVGKLDAADLHPDSPLPPGTVVYLDPPYAGTTGYAHALPRDAVLEVAERWRAAGALVAVSEAEPLPLPGWHHVDLTGARRGQRRTFSKQQAEWLTVSAEPAWRPATQEPLFAAPP